MTTRALHKVEGHPQLRKDPYSKAVLNTDIAAARRHALREQAQAKETQREAEIRGLRNEIQELRDMLRQVLTGSKG